MDVKVYKHIEGEGVFRFTAGDLALFPFSFVMCDCNFCGSKRDFHVKDFLSKELPYDRNITVMCTFCRRAIKRFRVNKI